MYAMTLTEWASGRGTWKPDASGPTSTGRSGPAP
jgi:hypothetical protein